MKVLYFKVGSTGLGYDRESGLPDAVLRVCYQLDEVDGDKHTKLDGGEVLYRPEFRTNWPEASMKNGVWPESVEDCKLFRYDRGKYYNLMNNADLVVMDNLRFNRTILMQSGFMFPLGQKYVDVVDEYAKQHPEILVDGKTRSSMDEIAEKLYYLKTPDTPMEKLEAIIDVYKRLDKSSLNKMSVEDFTKNAPRDFYIPLDINRKARVKAEEISDAIVNEDKLFDTELETSTARSQFFSSRNEKVLREGLRKEQIRKIVNHKSVTEEMVRNTLLSTKVKIMGIENRVTSMRDDIVVTYKIDGRVYHQKYASEQMDGMAQAYVGRKERKWYVMEDADNHREKGLFKSLSEDDRQIVMKGILEKCGKLSFLPNIEKCSKSLQEFYRVASHTKGDSFVINKSDLEYVMGKSWEDIHNELWDDFQKMDSNKRKECINVPLENLVAYTRGKDDTEKIVISSELACMFSMPANFDMEKSDSRILSSHFGNEETVAFDKFVFDRYITSNDNVKVEDVFHVKVYCSGSSSNCALIKTPDETILLDAGPGVRNIASALKEDGLKMKDVDMMFFTHEHGDHVKLSESLLKDEPVKFASLGTWQGLLNKKAKGLNAKTCLAMPDRLVTKSRLEIRKIDTSHDTNSPSMYQFLKNGKSLVWVTDTGRVTDSVKRAVETADHLVIEANYEERLLKVDPNHNDYLQCRIHSNQGHLSNHQTEDLLAELENPPKKIWIAHVSETSNTEEHVRAMIHRAMKRNPRLEYSEFKILKQDENMKMTPRNRKPVPVIPADYHVKTDELKRS